MTRQEKDAILNTMDEEKVEYYEDWKKFGSEGSSDEWDQHIENAQRSLWTPLSRSR